MPYKQRDVVKISAQLPDGNTATHPFVIISCGVANSRENFYTGVMMTGSTHKDVFSFSIADSMFESPLEKGNCHIRLYILTSFREIQVTKFVSRMKKAFFVQLVKQITEITFKVDND